MWFTIYDNFLKDNSYLSYGFLTGILRVAKESIFSGLNNLKINSILDDRYSEYEYSRAVTPQIRQAGNHLSGLAETAYASLLAQCFV